MTDKAELQRLSASGMSLAEAARALGISRQRAFQLGGQFGVKFRDGRLGPWAVRKLPSKVAELKVAADLLARGWHVFLAISPMSPHDLVAIRDKDKRTITLEVRSGYMTGKGKAYCFKKAGSKSDYYAIVVAGEPVHYDPELVI